MTDDGQDLAALENLAARVAPELAGLTREQAEAHLAATDPRLSARFAEAGDMLTMEYRYGRVTATLADGVVVRAVPG